MSQRKRIIFIASPILLIATVLLYFILSYPTTSPLNSSYYLIQALLHPHAKLNQKVIGFLPYWRLPDSQYIRFDLMSEINYFSLTVDTDGNIDKVANNQEDPGWHGWNSQTVKDLIAKTQISGNKFTLTITAQRNKIIESILSDPNKQHVLLANIQQLVNERHLDGINIDFEYLGSPDQTYQNQFTQFIQKLRQNHPKLLISVSVMPAAASGKDLFDFAKLQPLVDQFIIMSYDYYSNNSQIAGPVAPMKGFAEGKYYFDVTTTYSNLSKVIPVNKIIMGIQYYGWDWAVENGPTIQSPVLPTDNPHNYAAVLSYARMREDKDLKPQNCLWDDYAEEHWCWYTDKNGTDHQVWLEDNQSLGVKFNFAKQNHFQGIAIWNLGYDTHYPDLWNQIKNTFK